MREREYWCQPASKHYLDSKTIEKLDIRLLNINIAKFRRQMQWTEMLFLPSYCNTIVHIN